MCRSQGQIDRRTHRVFVENDRCPLGTLGTRDIEHQNRYVSTPESGQPASVGVFIVVELVFICFAVIFYISNFSETSMYHL